MVHSLHYAILHDSPFVVDDHEAPGRAATDHPASVLFEKYAHGREEDFSKSCLKGRIAGWAARKYLCAMNIGPKRREYLSLFPKH